MPAETTSGRFERQYDVNLTPAAPITTTGNGAGLELGDAAEVRLTLAVTAVAGTNPTLDTAVQTSPDNATWTTIASFAQKTGTGSEHKNFTGLDHWVRLSHTVGGTGSPSFTITCTGEAV